MAARHGILQFGRPVLLRPFTSVTAPAQDTKTPEFEFRVPRQEDGSIALDEVQWLDTRFVFVFLNEKLLADPETMEGEKQRFWLGQLSRGNPLVVVVKVEANGKQSLCFGGTYRAALARDEVPTFGSGKWELPLDPQQVAGNIEGSYAVASPVLLPLGAIDKLSESRPSGVPILGTGMATSIPAGASATPANPDWVFPIVDPILIAENLTRKYYEACDAFLAASQDYDRPAARNQGETNERKEGELLALKKMIADNLVGLKQATPGQAAVFDGALRPGQPECFRDEYRKALEDLAFERELAAFMLIAWLETEVYQLTDDFWPRDDGKPERTYEAYVKASLDALARLAESDRGLKYLSEMGRRHEAGSSPVPSGVLHVTTEFLFRESKSSDEQRTLAVKSSASLFSAWSAFVAARLAVVQRLVRKPNPSTSLIEDLQTFSAYLFFVFHERILEVDVRSIPLNLPPRRAGSLVEAVNLRAPTFVLGQDPAGPLKKAKLVNDHVTRVCAVLNLGIAYEAWRKTLEENGDARAKTLAIADLAAASLGVFDQLAALKSAEGFRSRMAGKLNMGGKLLGNRAAGTFGLLGAVASLVSASVGTVEEYKRGDWDESTAHFTEGFGALVSGAGATIILVSGTTGPLALWTLAAGATISAAGFIWSVFAADTELDQMLKFCAFGKQAGEPAIKPPGWTQCENTFAEWDPKTVDGLVRQLKAFQQIFYSFEASGAEPVELAPLASDGILRITPSSLRLACSFEIEYTAVYLVPGPGSEATKKTLKGKATVRIPSIIVEKFTLVDPNGNYETEGAVRPHRDGGRDALDVRFRLTKTARENFGKSPELESLTCLVQLRVPGAGVGSTDDPNGTLVIPMSVKGPRRVKVDAVKHRHSDTASNRSLDDQRHQ